MINFKLPLIILATVCFMAGCSAVESTGDAVSSVGHGVGKGVSGASQAIGDAGSAIAEGAGDIISGTGEAIEDGASKTRQRGY